MKPALVVPGHTLLFEGAPFSLSLLSARMVPSGRGIREGSGVCSCGAASSTLQSNAVRRRWHRDHKIAVQAEGQPH